MFNIKKLKYFCISLFICLNVTTVLFINSPQRIRKPLNKFLNSLIKSQKDSKENFIFKGLRDYSQIAGISRWYMFNTIDPYNWWYLVKANYKSSEAIVINLPTQSKRTFLERNLFDFREPKIQNALRREDFRHNRYGPYLCRKFQKKGISDIENITFELYEQMVVEPKYISKQGYYLDPTIKKTYLGKVICTERRTIK